MEQHGDITKVLFPAMIGIKDEFIDGRVKLFVISIMIAIKVFWPWACVNRHSKFKNYNQSKFKMDLICCMNSVVSNVSL